MARKISTTTSRVVNRAAAPTAKQAAAKPANPRKAASKTPSKPPSRPPRRPATPVLLSGENPQIAKGYGDAPVRAYIAAIPGWKRAAARRLDAIIARAVPGVRRAVKWNSPLYGAPEAPSNDWFLGVHCFTNYIKVAFFRGSSLSPVPPGASKQKEVRYLDIHKDWGSPPDEAQFADWVKQASRLPGERM